MIKDIISENAVQTEVEANSWRDAVQIVGTLLKEEGKIEDSFINSMIETVEELGPYMILLPGVAFFHGSPQSGVNEVCLSFVTFKEDVIFTDFDQQSIQCAFAFGAIDKDSHMQVLMQVAGLLQDEEFLALAKNHGSKEAIWKKIQQF